MQIEGLYLIKFAKEMTHIMDSISNNGPVSHLVSLVYFRHEIDHLSCIHLSKNDERKID